LADSRCNPSLSKTPQKKGESTIVAKNPKTHTFRSLKNRYFPMRVRCRCFFPWRGEAMMCMIGTSKVRALEDYVISSL
jgi:hypothetical protein